MTNLLNKLVDNMADIQKWDLDKLILLVNPKDLEEVKQAKEFSPFTNPIERPEWEGEAVGILWGHWLITSTQVGQGCPEAVPPNHSAVLNASLNSVSDNKDFALQRIKETHAKEIEELKLKFTDKKKYKKLKKKKKKEKKIAKILNKFKVTG